MSVYKRKDSPHYHYDFQVRGRRFHGSTGRQSRREAEAVERAEREKAKALFRRGPDNAAILTLDDAAGRYWREVGQHHACADETWANLERLLACPHLGKDMRLCDIHDNEVTNLVAWRRGHRRRGRKDAPLISNATVNRSTTEVLQKIFTRAKTKWSARFDDEPDWKEHMLDEPKARGRELRQGERAALLDEAIRNDYADYYEFVHAVGQRAYKECLIEWSNVHWPEREIEVEGKQGRTITYPITETVAAILRQQIGKHPKWVFTYVAARNDRRKGLVKGQRYPITKSGAKTRWKRDRKKAAAVCPSVANLRTHDLRHDVATKATRKFGIKVAQEMLNHASINITSAFYAHVEKDEKRAAFESVQADQKSQDKSRASPSKVA